MRPIGGFLMRKGDPIGQFLGRLLLRPFVQMLWPTPEEQRREFEIIQKTDPLRRLGISTDPPEIWKSLLWWSIFIVGMGLALYLSVHLRRQ
jgi:hypothetical protein